MESSTSEKHFQFFSNSKCEYFPFHPTNDPENFNCLFCYCPLYALGDKCGGNFNYIAGGIKDCSGCLFPHIPENYQAVNSRYQEILDIIAGEMKK